MIYGEDPFRRRSRNIDGQVKKTGKVCLNGGISGQMAFRTRADLQNRAIGLAAEGWSSLGGGPVVRFPRIWMSSGKCRFRSLLKQSKEHEAASFSLIASLPPAPDIPVAVTDFRV